MWRKLLSNQDIDSISEGNIIIKYPIDGEPQPEIDLSSEEIFMLYEVFQVSGGEVLLQVPAEDLRADPGFSYVSPAGLQKAVCLSKSDLVQQRVWWIK
ncbi:MAG: hypothetical protein DI535_27210 [Citrobacter freundii]|nr:MAG: hypothetical protein DI535_27210 [Citrobacter freundii]